MGLYSLELEKNCLEGEASALMIKDFLESPDDVQLIKPLYNEINITSSLRILLLSENNLGDTGCRILGPTLK